MLWRGALSSSYFRPRVGHCVGSVVFIFLLAATWRGPSYPGHLPGAQPNQDQDIQYGSRSVTAPPSRLARCSLIDSNPDGAQDTFKGFVPNELGKVMIVMYHDIQREEKEWVRSRENFRKDLQRFYEEGFVLVNLSSYLTGDVRVPGGKTPLVLTFDDATPGQFRFVEQDGRLVPDPDCAVGILLDFCGSHPDFGCAATFFVDFPAPFGDASQVEAKFRFLLEHGMEIGNHTYNHRNLRNSTPEEIREELGRLTKSVRDICGYEVTSMALPYGAYPACKEALTSGSWNDTTYRNLGVLLVGAGPAPSPYSRDFDPLAVPRIRGSDDELNKWLTYFRRNPSQRFVSDGQPEIVTVLPGQEDRVARERLGGRSLVVRGKRKDSGPGF